MLLIAHADGVFEAGGRVMRCALGRGGVADSRMKREGDGGSPAGVWPLRRVLYRADRGARPRTRLPTIALGPDDGWCDDPRDGAYNRPVTLPYPAGAEALWREDGLYDLIVILGYNDDPVVAGAGSAIFLHVAAPDFAPTQGCVALARPDLESVLALVGPGDCLAIRPAASGV